MSKKGDSEKKESPSINIQHMKDSIFVGGDVNGDAVINKSSGNIANDNSLDTQILAEELAQLRLALKAESQTSEHDIAIGAVAQAEKAVEANDLGSALKYLSMAGQWALDVATKIGVSIAAEALKKALL